MPSDSGDDATIDDLREALTTLEDAGRTARRVLGGAHPITAGIERDLQMARAGLSARDSDVESMIRAFETIKLIRAPEVD